MLCVVIVEHTRSTVSLTQSPLLCTARAPVQFVAWRWFLDCMLAHVSVSPTSTQRHLLDPRFSRALTEPEVGDCGIVFVGVVTHAHITYCLTTSDGAESIYRRGYECADT